MLSILQRANSQMVPNKAIKQMAEAKTPSRKIRATINKLMSKYDIIANDESRSMVPLNDRRIRGRTPCANGTAEKVQKR